MCVLIFSPTFVRNISHSKKKMRVIWQKIFIDPYGKRPLFCPILIKIGFFRQIFEKCSYIKFNENPFIGSRVFPCGRTNSHDEAVRNLRTRLKIDTRGSSASLTLQDTSYSWQMGPHGSLYQGYSNLWSVEQFGIFGPRYAFTWKSCCFSKYSL